MSKAPKPYRIKQIGVRELKDSLSATLREVSQGATYVVTHHSSSLVQLLPMHRKPPLTEMLGQLVGANRIRWAGGKPMSLKEQVKGRGQEVSAVVLEDRR